MTKPCPKCRTATERDGEICIILIHVVIKYFGFKFQYTYFEVCYLSHLTPLEKRKKNCGNIKIQPKTRSGEESIDEKVVPK